MKRREFIKIAAASAPLLSVPFFLEGCATNPFRDLASGPKKNGGVAPYGIRPSVTSEEGKANLKSYAKAIAKMRTLPDANGCSWYAQSQVHNNHCWHNSWYFFPWHRDYLHRFEAIIRIQSDDPNFMLPYWDWTSNPGLPDQFMNINDPDFGQLACSSKTWDKTADPSRANGDAVKTQIASVTNSTLLAQIMDSADFATFMGGEDAAGGTEGGPHNGVHAIIGTYGGPMGDFTSPLDPIFWLHHCNVDRIWAAWQQKNPDWTNADKIGSLEDGSIAGSKWLDQKLQGFYDLSGKRVPDSSANTPKDMLTLPPLNYSYADLAVGTKPPAAAPTSERVRLGDRHLASDGDNPTKVAAFTEKSIIDSSKGKGGVVWDADNAGAQIFLKPLGDDNSKHVADYVNNYLADRSASTNFFRLRVANLPKLLVSPRSKGAGPLMKITLSAGTFRTSLGYFNFFVPEHPKKPVRGKHSSMVMDHPLPAGHFNYGLVLKALKDAGITRYPDDLSINVEFKNPEDGAPLKVDPAQFGKVELKIVVMG